MVRLLIIGVFLSSLIWMMVVPIWHFPDEQAHFGQVAFLSETGRNSKGDELDLTEEIFVSEELLGTKRDNLGNNKFTFHPEYRIEYTTNLIGKYEASIAALSNTQAKKNFIYREAARYPQLYYLPATFIYEFFYDQDLFVRVYLIRFWSLFLFLGTIYFIFKLAQLLFEKNELLTISLTLLVGFQPMMVFSSVGVNSDALGNLLFTCFLYLSVLILSQGISVKRVIFLITVSLLSLFVKPQFVILIPVITILLIWTLSQNLKNKKNIIWLIITASISLFVTLTILYFFKFGPVTVLMRFIRTVNIYSLYKYTLEYTLPHTINEVLPWYWGIFDWLGVTYPRIIHRIINRIIIISLIGVLLWLINILRKAKLNDKKNQVILFLGITSLLYFIAVSFYDWMLWYSSKYPLGVQGRYFFPVIVVHMLFLLLGWEYLFPQKIKPLAVKTLGILMISLNFYALYTVAKTYYDLSSYRLFIIQASQYKPLFVKGAGLTFILLLLIIFLIVFLIEYIKYPYEKDFKTSSQK